MIIASLYSKPVNKSIAFHYGQKNNGYSAFIPNTRYLVYQPRLTDAIIVIFGLLSYEHPCKKRGLFNQNVATSGSAGWAFFVTSSVVRTGPTSPLYRGCFSAVIFAVTMTHERGSSVPA